MPSRLVFMGTPDFAVPALQALLHSGHAVVGVYSQPPKPRGRGHEVQKSPVQLVAEAAGIPVLVPRTLKTPEAQAELAALQPDLVVVAAYGLLLPQVVLDIPGRGCLNIHASLLPRWRGAAPIHRAILAGDSESGVCLMGMEAGLDTGPVFAEARLPIAPRMTTPELHDALSALGGDLLRAKLDEILAGALVPVAQTEAGMTYAAKLTRDEGQLEWAEPAVVLDRKVRGLQPWPGTFFTHSGEEVKVLAAVPVAGQGEPGSVLDKELTVACGAGALTLLRVQRPGRGPVSGAEFMRAVGLTVGASL